MVFMVLCLALITCCLQNSPTWKNWRLKEQELWPQVHPGSKQFVQPMCWFHPTEWFPYYAMTKGKWEQGCSECYVLGGSEDHKGSWRVRPDSLQARRYANPEAGCKSCHFPHFPFSREVQKKKKKKKLLVSSVFLRKGPENYFSHLLIQKNENTQKKIIHRKCWFQTNFL